MQHTQYLVASASFSMYRQLKTLRSRGRTRVRRLPKEPVEPPLGIAAAEPTLRTLLTMLSFRSVLPPAHRRMLSVMQP